VVGSLGKRLGGISGFDFGGLGDENLVLEVIAGHEVVVALI
jgi:hypothetical protein